VHLGVDGHEVPAKEVWGLAEEWLDRDDPVSWNQALMDLGREVCRPKPRCDVCPLAGVCRFRRDGATASRGLSRQEPFEGSTRQVRGAVVNALRSHPWLTPARLASETGFPVDRVDAAVATLSVDGLVEVDGGRVRLAS
jgi:A/G-specific adenine glycosylase